MSLRVGPYTFAYVSYDAPSDVIYATIDNGRSVRRERTPEDHIWLYDERGRFHGLALMEPRERLERHGQLLVTLPSGERERVSGVEAAMRTSRG